MRLAFMGSDPIALPLLDHLHQACPEGCQLELVFTQPDRRSGRGMKLHANAIKEWAVNKGIEVQQPVKCGPAEADLLKQREIELVLVMAYGQILPGSILRAVPHPVLNIHASTLPRLRGASPIHSAVALGLQQTGVSLMEIVPKLDAGPVAAHEGVAIAIEDGIADVIRKLSLATVDLVDRGLSRLAAGTLVFVEQDPAKVSYCRILEKADCHLDFTQSAETLYNRIRAFQPWPGAAFPLNDQEVRIHAARFDRASTGELSPGTLDLSEGTLRIACGGGWLLPEILQRPGGKPLGEAEFRRGFDMRPGQVVESRPMRPLESDQPFPYKKK